MSRPISWPGPTTGAEHALPSWLGGDPAHLAVDLGGQRLTYAEFADRARAESPAGNGLVIATAADPLTVLTRCFAAMLAGRPVLIADPDRPSPPVTPSVGAELLVTTSGSAGRPRVVARTRESWRASFASLAQLTGLTAADEVALTGPLNASLHLFGAMHTLWLGAALTDQLAAATAVHCVPTVLADLLTRRHRLRLAVVAGSAMTSALAERAAAAGVAVTEYYGAAELSLVAAGRHPDGLRAFPGVQIDIRDGVLWARSPYLALGYAGPESGTLLVDDDGFASVGDLATLDMGVLTVRGRGDAAITTGGETVIAEDVENVLAALPGVRSVAVIGVPHERFGELVVAVLELAATADTAGLKAAARRQLQPNAVPRRWFEATLPRTPGGKVARAAVRSGLLDGSMAARPLA